MTNVTCEMTAKKPGSAPCPVLIMEYVTTLLCLLYETATTAAEFSLNSLLHIFNTAAPGSSHGNLYNWAVKSFTGQTSFQMPTQWPTSTEALKPHLLENSLNPFSPTLFSLCPKWVYQSIQCHTGLNHPFNVLTFGHSPECPNVKKIKKGALDQYGTERSEV